MKSSSKTYRALNGVVVRCDADGVFGEPPLAGSEEPKDYLKMYAEITAAIMPKDFIEKLWVRDIADLTWEILRMRRDKASKSKWLEFANHPSDLLGDIEYIERVDRMVMHAEARRNAALREIERHRSSLSNALRRSSDEVIEGEFKNLGQDRATRRDVA